MTEEAEQKKETFEEKALRELAARVANQLMDRERQRFDAWAKGAAEARANGQPVAGSSIMTLDDFAILEAEFGNPEPLRSQYPKMPHLLNLPTHKPGKGNRNQEPEASNELLQAVRAIPRVRQVLKTMYGPKRPPFDATTVAAKLCRVDPDELKNLMDRKSIRKLLSLWSKQLKKAK